MTNAFHASTNAGAAAKTVAFAYDVYGRMISYSDGTTSGTFVYDDTNRTRTATIDFGPFSKSYTYEYDSVGRPSAFTCGSISNSFSYDAAGRLTGVSIPGEGTITFNADSRGLPSGVTMPGGTSKQFGYDPMMSLVTNVAVDSAQNAVMSRIYSRNKVQNIIGQKTEHGTYAYQYDQLDQLTNSIHPVFTNESFVYDPMGNRLSSSGGMRVVASTYGANVLNQYTNLTTQQPGNSTTAVLGYDLNGNQLVHYRSSTDGSWTTNYLSWDISDRLAEIRDASSNLVARYTYDPFGRRLSRTVFSGATSNVTYFLYADEGLVAEFDEAGNEIRVYGYAPGSLWMNDPLYLRTFDGTPSTFYFLTDHLGAPQKLVDKNGAVVWAMVSESFGETVVWEGSTITNNLRFSSQYWDEESGLHYNTLRYYDPVLARFLNRDPIGERGGINQYRSCANNFLLYVDRLGLVARFIKRENGMYYFIDRDTGALVRLKDVKRAQAPCCKDVTLNQTAQKAGDAAMKESRKARPLRLGGLAVYFEFCGRLCCNKSKDEAIFTKPVIGFFDAKEGVMSCDPTKSKPCPDGYGLAGYYHSHPGLGADLSPDDIRWAFSKGSGYPFFMTSEGPTIRLTPGYGVEESGTTPGAASVPRSPIGQVDVLGDGGVVQSKKYVLP